MEFKISHYLLKMDSKLFWQQTAPKHLMMLLQYDRKILPHPPYGSSYIPVLLTHRKGLWFNNNSMSVFSIFYTSISFIPADLPYWWLGGPSPSFGGFCSRLRGAGKSHGTMDKKQEHDRYFNRTKKMLLVIAAQQRKMWRNGGTLLTMTSYQ